MRSKVALHRLCGDQELRSRSWPAGLQNDTPPVLESDAVHAADAAIEELVRRHPAAEVALAERVDRTLDLVAVVCPEDIKDDGRHEAPLLELLGDHSGSRTR